MSITWDWGKDPLTFVEEVEKGAVKLTKEVAQAVFEGVVRRSPVLTGKFRASWRVSVNAPDYVVPPRIVPGSQPVIPAPDWPGINVRIGDLIYISNGAPYGERLENGWSQQAPNGMLALTLAEVGLM